ncbi:uncharacterized protein ACFDR9_000489 [Janthinobacterium sp. CG_23.3]|uniref:DUF1993 domain-containing protein n=1 Tax=Janthinobacterium sp. CG_23.3 TaxID=3349634 RepID=UPI0038D43123
MRHSNPNDDLPMPLSMYQSSVPVFTRYLRQLSALVQLAADHAAAADTGPATLLHTRLAPDMNHFLSQVQTTDDFALRTCALLSGTAKLDHGPDETGFTGLRARIARSEAHLRALAPALFEGSETRILHSQAGQAMLELDGQTFLQHYALPNFFFHLTSAYAILRHLGARLGKQDFDGFHDYPRA